MIGRPEDVVLRHSQHARCRLKIARHLRLPIRQTCPRPGIPNLLWRRKQGTSVRDRSAADRAAVEDGGMTEHTHVEKPTEAELHTPELTMKVPTRNPEIPGRPATPH